MSAQSGMYMTAGGPVMMNWEMAIAQLSNDHTIGIDLETSGLHHKTSKIAVVSLHGNQSGRTAVLHNRGHMPEPLAKFIEDKNTIRIGHNIFAFDMLLLGEAGIDVWPGKWYDTLVGECVILTSDRRDVSVSLRATGKRRTKHKVKSDPIDHGHWMNPILTPEQIEYCANDVRSLGQIMAQQLNKADPDQKQALDLEMAIGPAVSRVMFNGLPIDLSELYPYLREQRVKRYKIGTALKAFFGIPHPGDCDCKRCINLDSPIQLRKGLRAAGVEDTNGKLVESTAAPLLEEIAMFGGRDGRLCQAILDYRYAATRLKNWGPNWINEHVVGGRIYPKLWQVSTDTGRFSSSNPNAQQIPKDMRKVFGNIDGYTIISADYAQIEVRVAAAIAQDTNLINIIEQGLHIHTSLASQVFDIPYEELRQRVKDEDLQAKQLVFLTKGITFLLLFGGGKNKFFHYAKQGGSGLTYQECSRIVDKFYVKFPGILAMREKAQTVAGSGRPVTLKMSSGLKRVLVGEKIRSTRILNTLVQGNAAAGIKYAILECRKRGLDKYLSLQLHDELVATVPNAEVKDYIKELEESMIKGMQRIMSVPATVEVKFGPVWQR